MRERGGIDMGCLFMAALLAGGGYFGWMFGLPYYYNSVLEQKLFESAEQIFHQEQDIVMQEILKTAADNKVALTAKNVTVRQTSSEIFIDVKYQVPVVTPVYSRTLDFSINVTRKFSR